MQSWFLKWMKVCEVRGRRSAQRHERKTDTLEVGSASVHHPQREEPSTPFSPAGQGFAAVR